MRILKIWIALIALVICAAFVVGYADDKTEPVPTDTTAQDTIKDTLKGDKQEAPKPAKLKPKTFQEPSDFPKGSAERTLAEFMAAWKAEDWEEMAKHCQLTWLADHKDATGLLEANFGFLTLYEFKITNVTGGPGFKKITFSITGLVYDMPSMEKKQIREANVIKEIAPRKPSEAATWGVNPISALS